MVFQGEFDHSVDDKGRVIIPNKMRSSLGAIFYMTKGVGGCIFVYTEGEIPEAEREAQRDSHCWTRTRCGSSDSSPRRN